MLAHELRNPLGTISNALQVLRLKGEGDETWRRAIDAAERQVHPPGPAGRRPAGGLAGDPRRGRAPLRAARPAELVRETVEGYRATLRDAGLDARRSSCRTSRCPVRGDRLRLAPGARQPAHNAVKFTAPRRPRSRCGPAAPRGGAPRSSVRDTGAGIGPEMLPHVFEVFTQADQQPGPQQGRAGRGARGGQGPGRAARRRGAWRASAARGRGSEFSAAAAARRPGGGGGPEPAVAAIGEAGGRHEGRARRILVVEDNPDAGGHPARLPGALRPRGGARQLRHATASRPPASSTPRWCSATSGCPGWTASRWRPSCGATRRPPRRG